MKRKAAVEQQNIESFVPAVEDEPQKEDDAAEIANEIGYLKQKISVGLDELISYRSRLTDMGGNTK
jgi:hypothetical protein